MNETVIRASRVDHGSQVEGPGMRSVLWVQGCSIRCPGCINPQLFDAKGGFDLDCRTFVMDAADSGSEGITVLGGEPFDQPASLAFLAQSASEANLGVIIFTGYTMDTLVHGDKNVRQVLEYCDLLVDGPFQPAHPETERALVGSINQRFIKLTDRYAKFDPTQSRNRVQLSLLPDGSVNMSGFISTQGANQVRDSIGARRAIRTPRNSPAPGSSTEHLNVRQNVDS